MPVFDTAAHVQRIPTYREGKALRLANRNRELINEQIEQDIEYYPAQEERADKQVDIQEDSLGLRREELDARIAEYRSASTAEDFEIAVGAAVAGLDADDRGEDGTEAMRAYLNERDPEEDTSGLEFKREEALALTSGLEKEKPTAPKDHVNFELDGQLIAARPDSKLADALVAAGAVRAGTKSTASKSDKQPTSAQGKAAGYAIRLADANKIFQELENDGHDYTDFFPSKQSIIPNRWKSDAFQKFEQAKENFINAVLRPESGAAIAPSEFEKADLQYFPQPGDGDEVVKQKKANRIAKQAAMEAEAGVEALRLAQGRVDALTAQENPDELRLQELGF